MHRDLQTSKEIQISLVVIPQSLIGITTVLELEEWILYWYQQYVGAMRDVMRANSALAVERGVRVNVARKTFLNWRLENIRFFVTERELSFWTRKGVLKLM